MMLYLTNCPRPRCRNVILLNPFNILPLSVLGFFLRDVVFKKKSDPIKKTASMYKVFTWPAAMLLL